MNNDLIISFENGLTISIRDTRMIPDKTTISISQFVGLTKLFNNICETSKYDESNISDLENGLNSIKGIVQGARSKSAKGIVRGLHFQKDPYCQSKIVEC